MTLAEYKAAPESWEPTFTVATLADYTKRQDRVSGNDYERVFVSANITAAAGIDLTYSRTKQVVFADGVTLTLNLNELEGKCLYYREHSGDEELWMSKPRIAAKNAFASGNVYCFQNCDNIDGAAITATGGAGAVYCFQNCDNIDSPTITAATGGTGNGSAYCFHTCTNISGAVIMAATGGAGDSSHGIGGSVYGFHTCADISGATITNMTGGRGYSNTAIAGRGAEGGAAYDFYLCTGISNAVITNSSGGIGGNGNAGNPGAGAGVGGAGGAVYGFHTCANIDSPTIASATGGNASGGYTNTPAAGYGFYECTNVKDPKAVLSASIGPSYMHYMWTGIIVNRAGSNAKTALFSPDSGPYQLVLSNKPIPGQSVTLAWQFISPTGDAVSKSAVLQASTDNGAAWTNIYTGANTSFTYNVPSGIGNIRFRMSTSGSGYAYSDLTRFTSIPVISGEDEDLGTMAASFTPYQFSVSKAPDDESGWNAAFITVTLDGKTLQTFNTAIGDVKTLSIAASAWNKVINGGHTLKISAVRIIDGQPAGTESVRTLAFTRAQTRAALTLSSPAVSETRPERIELSIGGAFPAGSSLTVETCNNADDPEPAWEDMTAEYLAGTPRMFENDSKAAAEWGVNIRVTLERGTAQGSCYIDSIVGDFS